MKRLQVFFILVFLVLGFTTSNSAMAWRHGVRFGVFVGPGFYYPPPYYYPPYYYPPYAYPPVAYPPVAYPPVVYPPAPTTYIEQSAAQQAPAPVPGFWYYCDESKGYYPYVKECSSGWQKVAPQPAGQ